MHPSSCHHMIGAASGFHGDPATASLMNGFWPMGNGLGPLVTLGMLMLAALIISLIVWGAQEWKPAHEEAAPLFARQQFLSNENTHGVYWQAWPPQPASFSTHPPYEQPQAQYPELPAERPLSEQQPE